MDIIKSLIGKTLPPNVATIGFFDGVHLGHQNLISQVRRIAKERDLPSLIITFGEHPRKVLCADYQPELLNMLNEKLCLLAKCNTDYCYVLDFNKEVAKLNSYEFMKNYLKDKLNVKTLVVGYDHHFGCDKQDGFTAYKNYGQQLDIEVVKAEKFELNGELISSSSVRFCLQVGDVEKAAYLCGRPYSVDGTVIRGHQLGRKLGFPTANINIKGLHKMLPMDGVYAVTVSVQNSIYAGMAYIGRRPTVSTDGSRNLEVNILNFAQDIYDEELHIEFINRLRAEKRFNSYEELTEQLRLDLQKAEKCVKL